MSTTLSYIIQIPPSAKPLLGTIFTLKMDSTSTQKLSPRWLVLGHIHPQFSASVHASGTPTARTVSTYQRNNSKLRLNAEGMNGIDLGRCCATLMRKLLISTVARAHLTRPARTYLGKYSSTSHALLVLSSTPTSSALQAFEY